MKRSLILGFHVVLKDISPLVDSLVIWGILLDPKVEFLLNEQPPLDLQDVLSFHEPSELLCG